MPFIEYEVGALGQSELEALVNEVPEQGQNEDGSARLAGRRGPVETWKRRIGIRSSRAQWSGVRAAPSGRWGERFRALRDGEGDASEANTPPVFLRPLW
jgi:hypothetical protein